ncbi:YCF48-related protein [Alkalimonas sp. NCh-2]|uniref:WD40/YVTN/BNR-like repeat-containing protein n=1 Tax=Alkalimonas sp. NCh-2 TaxID=3144846 RepID=UPI0031F6D837
MKSACSIPLWIGMALFMSLASSAEQDRLAAQPAVLAPLAEHSLLTDITILPSNRLIAVGERGHILWSEDGVHWQQADVPVRANLNAVTFVDASHGWAVGHDASILHTQDGGASWQLQQFLPELDKPLLDVVFESREHGIAVGAYGLMYRTRDGGTSWEAEFHLELLDEEEQEYLLELKQDDPELYAVELTAILPHFNRIFVADNQLLMVGEAGFFAISDDFGQHWELLEPFYHGSLFDVAVTAEGHWLAVGLRGHVFLSEDEGESWQEMVLDSQATINSVIVLPEAIYLTGNAGLWAVSTDQGQSFVFSTEVDGRAIVNAVPFQQRMILATELGIRQLAQQSQKKP